MVNNNDITNTSEKHIFSDTVQHVGSWRGLLVISAVTFTELIDVKLLSGTWGGRTFPVGTFLTGEFTSVQLASGEVCMYA